MAPCTVLPQALALPGDLVLSLAGPQLAASAFPSSELAAAQMPDWKLIGSRWGCSGSPRHRERGFMRPAGSGWSGEEGRGLLQTWIPRCLPSRRQLGLWETFLVGCPAWGAHLPVDQTPPSHTTDGSASLRGTLRGCKEFLLHYFTISFWGVQAHPRDGPQVGCLRGK